MTFPQSDCSVVFQFLQVVPEMCPRAHCVIDIKGYQATQPYFNRNENYVRFHCFTAGTKCDRVNKYMIVTGKKQSGSRGPEAIRPQGDVPSSLISLRKTPDDIRWDQMAFTSAAAISSTGIFNHKCKGE